MSIISKLGYVGPDAAAMEARDEATCNCKHKSLSHSSTDPQGRFAGIGQGRCGYCSCNSFTQEGAR